MSTICWRRRSVRRVTPPPWRNGAAFAPGGCARSRPTSSRTSISAIFRLSTDPIPVRDRVNVWREIYGRKILRLEIEPLSDVPFHSDLTVQMLHDVGIVRGAHSPFRVGRSPQLLADGDDGLILQISKA